MVSFTGGQGAAAGRTGEIGFDRRVPGLTGIAVKGFLLSLITFGIYRFWYITELRRYFWSRTIVDGSPAEYTGRGKELFLGFLVALAILIPIYVAIFVTTISMPQLAPVGGVFSFVVLFLLGQYALYRGRRYRASRTLWRGIRLGQDGSGFVYALMAAGWWILTVLTSGLAFPFLRASLERYRINHTLIGSSRMTSEAKGLSILLPWLLFYAVVFLPIAATLFAAFVALGYTIPSDLIETNALGKNVLNPDYKDAVGGPLGVALVAAPSFGLIAAVLLIPFYRARETRVFMNAASLGPVRLSSNLRARQFYWPYIVYFLSIVGFFLLVAVLIGGASWLLYGVGAQTGYQVVLGLGLFLAYLGGALLAAVLYVRVITARLWHAVATTTVVENAGDLDAILASSRRQASGLNEGMADALDVGGALEIGF